jgi:hypothetical protein
MNEHGFPDDDYKFIYSDRGGRGPVFWSEKGVF